MPIEKGGSKTLSLFNDLTYPQFLVLVFLRDSQGNLSGFHSSSIFSNRSEVLNYIDRMKVEIPLSLRSDAFDSYTDAFTPAFRVYHLTRAKI